MNLPGATFALLLAFTAAMQLPPRQQRSGSKTTPRRKSRAYNSTDPTPGNLTADENLTNYTAKQTMLEVVETGLLVANLVKAGALGPLDIFGSVDLGNLSSLGFGNFSRSHWSGPSHSHRSGRPALDVTNASRGAAQRYSEQITQWKGHAGLSGRKASTVNTTKPRQWRMANLLESGASMDDKDGISSVKMHGFGTVLQNQARSSLTSLLTNKTGAGAVISLTKSLSVRIAGAFSNVISLLNNAFGAMLSKPAQLSEVGGQKIEQMIGGG